MTETAELLACSNCGRPVREALGEHSRTLAQACPTTLSGMAYDGDDPSGLVGEQLNTVAFVMDYVEFKFNGPVLRALTSPIVEGGGVRLRFPEPGSRDALCSLIGSEVAAVEITDDDRIELRLNGDRRLTIPLDRESRGGVEAAHYVPAAADGSLRTPDMLIW